MPHPECSFFTEKRERYLRADLEGRYANGGTSFTALTEDVVGALPPSGMPPARSRSGALRETAFDNYIDTHIFTALRRLGIPATDLSSDQEFLRRVTLDLTGRIPTADDVVQFLADPRGAEKRTEWIDYLLGHGYQLDYDPLRRSLQARLRVRAVLERRRLRADQRVVGLNSIPAKLTTDTSSMFHCS
ncbi:MAG: DUF1549 domain-containing protein [Acidobacteria bacterium]|nr:DUF1549 domain-containing protein [Acidobacteriota bacterium]